MGMTRPGLARNLALIALGAALLSIGRRLPRPTELRYEDEPAPAARALPEGFAAEATRLYQAWDALEKGVLHALETPGSDLSKLESEAAALVSGTQALKARLTEDSKARAYARAIDDAAAQLLVLSSGLRVRAGRPASYPDERLIADLEEYKVRKMQLQRESYALRGGRL